MTIPPGSTYVGQECRLTPGSRICETQSWCRFSGERWICVPCRSGGIGRRAWFRSTYSQGCGGSSPFFGTNCFFYSQWLLTCRNRLNRAIEPRTSSFLDSTRTYPSFRPRCRTSCSAATSTAGCWLILVCRIASSCQRSKSSCWQLEGWPPRSCIEFLSNGKAFIYSVEPAAL